MPPRHFSFPPQPGLETAVSNTATKPAAGTETTPEAEP